MGREIMNHENEFYSKQLEQGDCNSNGSFHFVIV